MDDLTWLRDLTRSAGELALAGASRLRWEIKPDHSFVTNLDREVERLLADSLRNRFPADAVWGEESGGEHRLAGRTWIIDPIDGTANLVLGVPVWGISVGVVEDGQPHLGVAHFPVTGETYWFQRGQGAFCNDSPLRVGDPGSLRREHTVAIAYEAFSELDFSRLRCRKRSLGSIVTHLACTARGAFQATVSLRDRLHDLGAAFGLALEAGCRAEWLSGGSADLSHWFENGTNDDPLLVGPATALESLRQFVSVRSGPPPAATTDGE